MNLAIESSGGLPVALLIGTGGLAGFVDSIAGGGGLLTLPALLAAGVPPVLALGTNKLQSTFGTVIACANYARGGHLDGRMLAGPAAAVLAGAALGAMTVQHVNAAFLAGLVPILLILIAGWFLFFPAVGDLDRRQRIRPATYGAVAAVIGFYDGVFGPGTGAFFAASLVALLGLGLLRATAGTKLLNATSNLVALGVLAAGNHVLWRLGLCMALANMAGGQLGSMTAMRLGTRLIKPLLVVVSLALTVKMLADPANPIARRLWG